MNQCELLEMTVIVADEIIQLHVEAKAYIRAFEITGDDSLLHIAWDLMTDADRLEINFL